MRKSYSQAMKVAPLWLLALTLSAAAAELRLGIIGTDTSHTVAFTRVLNDAGANNHIPGAKIVAAYKGGSAEIEESAKRVDGFANELKDKWSVQFVSSIKDLCPLVDGLLLESVDARTHLKQFKEAAACGKPIFIDKPIASTFHDALEIARVGREMNIPWFSSSTLRYSAIAAMKNSDLIGAIVWAPGPMEKHHELDLSWYGIHGVEMLYTILGPGCAEVSRMSSADSDVVTGRWKDGRLGTVHLQRPYGKYGAVVFHHDQKIDAEPDIKFSYVPLVKEIVAFVQTKTPAVPNAVTLEMFAFMDAAQKSLAQNGEAVALTAAQ